MTIDKGQASGQTCTVFDELKPGDRIEIEHGMVLDSEDELTKTTGTVLRTEHSFHAGQSGYQLGDLILMELSDGDLAIVTIGETTIVRRA